MTQMYEFILILFVPLTSFIFQKKIQNILQFMKVMDLKEIQAIIKE